MKVTFVRSLLMNQTYSGRGDLVVSAGGLLVTGRKLWGIVPRLVLLVPVWLVVAIVLGYGLTTSGLVPRDGHYYLLSLEKVGGVLQAIVALLVAWSVACAVGRRRVTDEFAFSAIRRRHTRGRQIKLAVSGVGTIRAVLRAKRDERAAFIRELEQKLDSQKP